MFAYFVCLYFSVLLVINGQQTLPPLETLPPNAVANTSSIISPFDESCMNADNSTDQDNVVYLGAVALNTDNECEVICQKQILQQFQIVFAGMIRTRAVIIGSVFTASMPDNSTCATNGTCSGGMCSVNSENSTMTGSTGMSMTTPMTMNGTETVTISPVNSTMTTMMSNSTTEMSTNTTSSSTTNSTAV